jgi:hypothetical protein
MVGWFSVRAVLARAGERLRPVTQTHSGVLETEAMTASAGTVGETSSCRRKRIDRSRLYP